VEKITNVLLTTGNDEDRKLILAAMTMQNDIRIIGVENDETNTIIKSEQLKPDVLIMDLQPPGIDGAELAPIIRRRSPDTSIIMMCDRDENDYADTAIRAGISGFLLRNADMNKLLPAVRIVNMGGYYISASIVKRALDSTALLKQFSCQFDNQYYSEKENSRLLLSPTERCIITEIAQGLSDDEIARHLHFSAGTVKNCITAIKRKTRLKNRVEIVVFSLVYGLISLKHLNIFQHRQFVNHTIQ
jgi:DNA-binding NarL/FixJ family response regulator